MKKVSRILVLGMLAMFMFSGVLLAEERDRYGEVGGTFIRLVEREIGEREHMGIVIKPHDRDDHVTILVPRQREELWQAARRLREGQKVGVSYVTETGQKWIKGMEAEWREVVEERPESRRRMNVRREVFRYEDTPERLEPRSPERLELRRPERLEPRRPEYLERMQELKRILSSNLDRMAREFRELRTHIGKLERELQILREENEQLRRELNERSGSNREHEREVRIRIQREGREREYRERPRAREMMLEGRRDEEAQRVRERAPDRGELAEILSMAAKLWREYDNADKSVAIGRLAEQLSGSRERQGRQQEQRVIRRRRVERREDE